MLENILEKAFVGLLSGAMICIMVVLWSRLSVFIKSKLGIKPVNKEKRNPDPYAKQVEELKAAQTKNQSNTDNAVMEQQLSLDEICPSVAPAPVTPSTDKPKKCFVVPLILCAALLACSLIGNIYQYSQNATLKKEYSSLEASSEYSDRNYKELSDRYFSIRDEYDFYHNGAVIVTETGSRYHTYSCYHWDYPIWIYNKEAAASEGYTPCKDCNPPQ